MNKVLTKITELLKITSTKADFLDVLFGVHKQDALDGKTIVLFGAGDLGEELNTTLKNNGIFPKYFCDNDNSRSTTSHCGLPILSFDDLKKNHKESLIIVATQKYLESVTKQLIENGFSEENILCKDSDHNTNVLFMYSMFGTQTVLTSYKNAYKPNKLYDVLLGKEERVQKAYDLLCDQKSKDLYTAKLAFLVSDGNFELFKNFILPFSEPIREFGAFKYNGTPEDYFYFNNDILAPEQDEVYVDVGAYDGDTVETFLEACTKYKVEYKHIYAFEPDPTCFKSLVNNTSEVEKLSCLELGLWSETTNISFITSEKTTIDQAGQINKDGNTTIKVVSLDEFLKGKSVSFIKMDPAGNIVPEVIKGSLNTIKKYKPKLALGAYHAFDSIFEIPILLNGMCPEYKFYLRHSTYHLSDTALFAII